MGLPLEVDQDFDDTSTGRTDGVESLGFPVTIAGNA
jgi:hypothetical protein